MSCLNLSPRWRNGTVGRPQAANVPRRGPKNQQICSHICLGQVRQIFQLGEHFLEHLSLPAFRLHTTTGILDRDHIQFYHTNHSTILVSSAINIGINGEAGRLDKLIAVVIAFSRFSLHDGGILQNPHDRTLWEIGTHPLEEGGWILPLFLPL